jgi:gas vesicle protein
MTNIKAKLEMLFERHQKLEQLLNEEKYASFFKQQMLFGDQVKDCLNSYSEEQLLSVIDQLKELKKRVKALKDRADICTKELKDKSLQLQRNKKKINAYK